MGEWSMEGFAELESDNCSFSKRSVIGSLIQKVEKMLKKPSIDCDLSQVLDEFIEKITLAENGTEYGSHILDINFAEVALLLQNSVDLYSKKLDLLWDIILDYQKRIILINEKDEKNPKAKEEIAKLEERKRRYRRKRKFDEAQPSTLSTDLDLSPTDNIDYLNQDYDIQDLSALWYKHKPPNHLLNVSSKYEYSETTLFLPEDNVYMLGEDNDYVGRYDQFSYVTALGTVFSLEDNSICSQNEALIRTRILRELPPYVVISSPEGSDLVLDKTGDIMEQCISKDTVVHLKRLPEDLLQDKLRRISTADSMFDSKILDDDDDDNDNDANTDQNLEVDCTMERRNKSVSQDSAFYDEDDLDEIIEELEKDLTVVDSTTPVVEPIKTKSSCVVLLKNLNLGTTKKVVEKTIKRDEKRCRKVPERVLRRLMKGVAATTVNKFERFFSMHYKSSEDEGQIPVFDYPSSDSDCSDDEVDNGWDDQLPENQTSTPFQPTTPAFSSTIPQDDERPSTSRGFTSEIEHETEAAAAEQDEEELHESGVFSNIFSSSPLRDTSESTLEETSRANVQKWRSFITPKLKRMEQRSDFNIHEYSTKIIESTDLGETKNFKDIVANTNSSEVARTFLAVLQLANMGNVDISGVLPGQVSNESLQVKIIDKNLHHDLLKEYTMPSEEMFNARLEKHKASNPKTFFHSTPVGPPAEKRRRLDTKCYQKKRLFKTQ